MKVAETMLAAMLAGSLFAPAFAGMPRKCTVEGKIVYSDTVCGPQSAKIDNTNGQPPATPDRLRAQQRAGIERISGKLDESVVMLRKMQKKHCDKLASNTAWTINTAKKYPDDLWWQNQVKNDQDRLHRECPDHFIINR